MKANLNVILQSQEQLAIQHEINKHLQLGLLETLSDKRKRIRHRKKLNLVSKENSRALLYYSSIVRIVLVIKAEREVIAIAEKTKKNSRKIQVIEDKQRNKIVAQERALQHQVEKDLKAIVVAKKLAIKEAKKK